MKKIQPSKSPLIHIKRFTKLFDLKFLLQVMYAISFYQSISADSNYFSKFGFKLLHKIKSESPIKQFSKTIYTLPEVLLNKAKP
jgi:hypothetical protein